MKEDELCRVDITLALRFEKDFVYDVYLRLSKDKVVKIGKQGDNVIDLLRKYHEKKDVQDIYISRDDFKHFSLVMKEGMKARFFNPETTEEEQVELLDKGHQVVKESLNKFGVSKENIEMAEEISRTSMKTINRTPNLFRFLKQFESTCSKEYLRSVLVGYTTICMIDTFEWKSDAIKEKASLAAMLCDITLEPRDFEDIRAYEGRTHEQSKETLSKRVLMHPQKVMSLLSEENAPWVSKETLTMIEQHHERPDGSGFPLGISHQRIPLLSALFMVAFRFVNLLFEYEFDFQRCNEIFAILHKEYGKANGRKAIDALATMLGI